METGGLKFRFKIEDLFNAIKKYCGIENVVIEKNEDIEGAVVSLLGSKRLIFVEVVSEECLIDGNNVIIGVKAFIPGQLKHDSCGTYDKYEELKLIREKFLKECKILQKMINVESKKEE